MEISIGFDATLVRSHRVQFNRFANPMTITTTHNITTILPHKSYDLQIANRAKSRRTLTVIALLHPQRHLASRATQSGQNCRNSFESILILQLAHCTQIPPSVQLTISPFAASGRRQRS